MLEHETEVRGTDGITTELRVLKFDSQMLGGCPVCPPNPRGDPGGRGVEFAAIGKLSPYFLQKANGACLSLISKDILSEGMRFAIAALSQTPLT